MWIENRCTRRDTNLKNKSYFAEKKEEKNTSIIQANLFLKGNSFFQFFMSFQKLPNGT